MIGPAGFMAGPKAEPPDDDRRARITRRMQQIVDILDVTTTDSRERRKLVYEYRMLRGSLDSPFEEGFTLIEVLICIAIIGILVALFVPGLVGNQQRFCEFTQPAILQARTYRDCLALSNCTITSEQLQFLRQTETRYPQCFTKTGLPSEVEK